ncbi:MAG: hypothetical protein C0184_14675, partial [Chloroflexus aggregans]
VGCASGVTKGTFAIVGLVLSFSGDIGVGTSISAGVGVNVGNGIGVAREVAVVGVGEADGLVGEETTVAVGDGCGTVGVTVDCGGMTTIDTGVPRLT